MKRFIICLVSALCVVGAVVIACDYRSDPIAAPGVVATLSADNTIYDAGVGGVASSDNGGVPAAALDVRIEASIRAPAGPWTVITTVDGAFALATVDGGFSTTNITSLGLSYPVIIEIPVHIAQPAETGFVHFQIGATRQTFTFPVGAVSPVVTLCTQTTSGDCVGDAAVNNVSGSQSVTPTVDDNGVETIPLDETSPDLLHNGDPFFVRVSLPNATGPSTLGATWSGSVTMTGVFALSLDGGTTNRVPIQYAKGAAFVTLPALVTGVGVGTISASVGVGAPTVLSRVSVSSSQAVHQVHLLKYVGMGAENQFTICSTRRSGSIHVQSANDAGTVVPVDTTLTSSAESCPAGYPSRAELIWTGYDAYAYLSIADAAGGIAILNVVPTLGTAQTATITMSAAPVWDCEGVDSTANGDAGTTTVQGVGADGGLQNPCPGAATLFVEVQVLRSTQTSATNGSLIPSVGSVLQVQAPNGVQISSSRIVTDTNGKATIELSIPPNRPRVSIIVSADGRAAQLIGIE